MSAGGAHPEAGGVVGLRMSPARVHASIAQARRVCAESRLRCAELTETRRRLDESIRRWRAGQGGPPAQVVHLAEQAVADPEIVAARAVGLTPRQVEVLQLLADGCGTEEIARALWLEPTTVRNHVAAIRRCLGVHSRLEAVARARRLGVL